MSDLGDCFQKDTTKKIGKYPENYETAVDLLNEIESILDTVEEEAESDNNMAAAGFAEGMRTNLEGFWDSIEEWQSATPNQIQALENMLAGAKKWIH